MTDYNLTAQNRYRLILSGDKMRGNKFEMKINNVILPGITGGLAELAAPVRTISQPGGSLSYDDLFVNFIISENLSEWIFIWNWIRDNNYGSCIDSVPYYCQADLIILTNKFNPLLSFTFHGAFPYILGTVDFRDDITTTETLTSNATFKFYDYTLNTIL